MVRSFGGYFGLHTAPSVWAGAPGIWSLRDISYFQQQTQWPAADTQQAVVAFTHGPDNIGGAPYLSVYRYSPGTSNVAPGGVGTKFPSPSDTVGFRNYGLAFSPDNKAIGAGAGQYNYYNFYRWTASGFGTRYSTPGDTGNLVIMDIHWNSSSNCVALACSTSGTPEYVYANGVSYTQSLYVYRWDATNGFGTKFADPVTLSYVPEWTYLWYSPTLQAWPSINRTKVQGVGGVSFNNGGDIIIHQNGEASPSMYAYYFSATSGFGALMSVPSTVAAGANPYYWGVGKEVQFTADDKAFFVSWAQDNQITPANTTYTYAITGNAYIPYNSGSKTIGNHVAIDGPQGGFTSISYKLRVGRNISQSPKTSRGVPISNSSIMYLGYYGNADGGKVSPGSYRPYISLQTNSFSRITGTLDAIYTSMDTYGNGGDVTPNGREAVYTTNISGAIRQVYLPLDLPNTLSTVPTFSSIPAAIANIPGSAHKVRFNFFQQDN